MEAIGDTAKVESYHAHVYYSDAATRAAAAALRETLQRRFAVAMGNWHDKPIGPHPLPMYQVSFAAREFARVLPFLMLNHDGLSILIHPNTDDGYRDHTEHALWLGAQRELRLDVLKRLLGQ
ncbi:MAG TPA: DOPA 4,5-dioxygenase family protein [Candidatus Binataceae bacterium]|nr:DOPA 4,5-dioxygenase family protein [Candidatus Binataceae bacterium]